MIVLTYKEIDRDGVVHLPQQGKEQAKKQANELYKQGYLNVKVVEIEEKVLYIPGGN
ncbi:hypothetical protein ACQPVP_08870 [Clostridium nigeriense]|uniref:hypothetical protein n=1 Tax=Clostridium nigeriense TaxID=1805470 RepID=UPI003D32FC5B